MRIICFLLLIIFPVLLNAQDRTQHIIPEKSNRQDQINKPYLILISADGFRLDLADMYMAKNLIRLRNSGVRSEYMLSVFPSLTFPNHYSIATGKYPSHEGIVDNSFYDPNSKRFYNMGKDILLKTVPGTALHQYGFWQKNRVYSRPVLLSRCRSRIQGIRPTYYYKYNTFIPLNERIRVVRAWLASPESVRPPQITFYMPEVDPEEHIYGVNSKQTANAVYTVDKAVGQLVEAIDSLQLPVNYIFISDHGMINIDTSHTISLPKAIDSIQFMIMNSMSLTHLYSRDSAYILPVYKQLKTESFDYDV